MKPRAFSILKATENGAWAGFISAWTVSSILLAVELASGVQSGIFYSVIGIALGVSGSPVRFSLGRFSPAHPCGNLDRSGGRLFYSPMSGVSDLWDSEGSGSRTSYRTRGMGGLVPTGNRSSSYSWIGQNVGAACRKS